MRLVDSHCHLQADRFDADRAEVVERARGAGVERILVPGWDLPSSRAAIELARRIDWLDAAVGIHPHDAGRAEAATWREVAELARDARVVAVGETGLDFDRMFSPAGVQVASLRRHIALGLELRKPVILHCRSTGGSTTAHDALLGELDRAGITPGRAWPTPPAVLHSFSGTPRFAGAALDRGLAVSISGLAFRRGEEATLAAVAAMTPLDRLLVETDSPYLPPPGAPRRRNEPEWVRVTAEAVAAARRAEPEAFGSAVVAAYDATFPRPGPRAAPHPS